MKLTVALPIYNGKDIAWLCLESLKRQKDVDFDWELIVFEEKHDQWLGPTYFQFFSPINPGNTKYLCQEKKLTLGEKWHTIAQKAHPDSKVMVFCAADNYYHPYMLRDSMDAIERGVDWFFTTKGFFYDFGTENIILYNSVRKTGLQMAASMEIAKTIPNQPRKRLVDIWLRNNMHPQNPQVDTSNHWQDTLFTHGYNTISSKRGDYFINTKRPFRKTAEKLEDIVPIEVAKRMKGMK